MSKALDYLMTIRPDVMKSYFDFIKSSSSHLDNRTRSIISVITKVDNQTEKGFKQYLVRALQAGVTPDEIIDALFASFPSLGLSKIIWAIEIILELDIPEFRPENLGSEKKWHEIGILDDIRQGASQREIEGRALIIYRTGEDTIVYDNQCPHQATRIPLTQLVDRILTCPRHHWKFDITTGQCIETGNRPLNRFACRIENNVLYASW